MLSEKSQWAQNGTMFVDLDWPLNASSPLSASAELLVWLYPHPRDWTLGNHLLGLLTVGANDLSTLLTVKVTVLGIHLWWWRCGTVTMWARRQKETVAAKDREIASLRRQLDASNTDLTEAGRGRDIALRENRRIQDDMALMTRENQVAAVTLARLFFYFLLWTVMYWIHEFSSFSYFWITGPGFSLIQSSL